MKQDEGQLSLEFSAQLKKQFESRDDWLFRQNVTTRNALDSLVINNRVANTVDWSFSNVVDDGYSVTNQKASGRCWLFAGLNAFRFPAMQNMKKKNFEFSQVYPFFWDKFERSNYWLEAVIETAAQSSDDRTVAFLLDNPLDDGGQWDMFVNIVNKYGAVPKNVMPETETSGSTRKMNAVLKRVLRDGARRLRSEHAKLVEAQEGKENSDAVITAAVREKKTDILKVVYRLLCFHLGTPPEKFDWQWNDKDRKLQRVGEMTPRMFADKYIGETINDYICLVHDPRPSSPEGHVFTVKYLGNIVGEHVRYLNVSMETLKNITLRMLQDGLLVWFGCDVSHDTWRKQGILAHGILDFGKLYDTEFPMNKAERLEYHDTMMTHAMTFTGVDVLENGKPRRWKVENSWGDSKGQKGFYVMDDAWFEENMFEIAAPRKYLSEAMLKTYDTETPIELPPWDPMGSLARNEAMNNVLLNNEDETL